MVLFAYLSKRRSSAKTRKLDAFRSLFFFFVRTLHRNKMATINIPTMHCNTHNMAHNALQYTIASGAGFAACRTELYTVYIAQWFAYGFAVETKLLRATSGFILMRRSCAEDNFALATWTKLKKNHLEFWMQFYGSSRKIEKHAFCLMDANLSHTNYLHRSCAQGSRLSLAAAQAIQLSASERNNGWPQFDPWAELRANARVFAHISDQAFGKYPHVRDDGARYPNAHERFGHGFGLSEALCTTVNLPRCVIKMATKIAWHATHCNV